MKKGFTLSELLVTMGAIGVIAALTIPAINSIRPNPTKSKYIKAYNALTNITNDILDDPVLYPMEYNAVGNPNCEGLDCYANIHQLQNENNIPVEAGLRTILINNNGFEEFEKYPRIVAYNMNLQGNIQFDETGDLGFGNATTYFTTTDGIQWFFSPNYDSALDGYNVYIDTDITNGSVNALYSSNQTKPDRFQFRVTNNGAVSAVDSLGQAFLENIADMKNISKDKDRAAAIEAAKNN